MSDSKKSTSNSTEEIIVREKDRLLFDAGRAAREKFAELEERIEIERTRQIKRFALLVLVGSAIASGIGVLTAIRGADRAAESSAGEAALKIQETATSSIASVQSQLPTIDQAAAKGVERIEQAERVASAAAVSRTLTSLQASFLTVQSGAASLYTLVSSRDRWDRSEFVDHLTMLKQSWSDSARLLELIAAGEGDIRDPGRRQLLGDTVETRDHARAALDRVQTLFVDNNNRNQYHKGE